MDNCISQFIEIFKPGENLQKPDEEILYSIIDNSDKRNVAKFFAIPEFAVKLGSILLLVKVLYM